MPSADFLAGLSDIGPLLVVAVPLGVYNFTEGMNNVESASAAGDNFDLRKVLLADGVGALAGAVLGSPFPPAVYIGHPGWKSVGGRIGYSFATGIVIALVCFLGLTALLLAVVPLVPILPILLYIGLVIGAQAFETTPARHAPAVILAMLPNIASWAQSQIDGALAAAGTSASQVGLDKLAGNGVIYHGLQLFGGGGTLAGLMLGAIAAFIIDRKFDRAALYALRRRGAGVLRLHQRHGAGVRQFGAGRAWLSADRADVRRFSAAIPPPPNCRWTKRVWAKRRRPNEAASAQQWRGCVTPTEAAMARSRPTAGMTIRRSGSPACADDAIMSRAAQLESGGAARPQILGRAVRGKGQHRHRRLANDGGCPGFAYTATTTAPRCSVCWTKARC